MGDLSLEIPTMSHHGQISFWEWLPCLLALCFGVLYIIGAVRITRKGKNWKFARSFIFVFGSLGVFISFYPTVMHYAHHDIRLHMVQHVFLGMFGPILWVYGAPVTLFFKSVPTRSGRMLSSILKSPVSAFFAHPFVALVLVMVPMFLLYLTPLYVWSLQLSWLHHLIHIHFVLAGYLFAASILEIDPTSRPISIPMRLGLLMVAIASHASFSKYMYANKLPQGSPFSDIHIQEAAKLMYYLGDLSEFTLLCGLFYIWYKAGGIGSKNRMPTRQTA